MNFEYLLKNLNNGRCETLYEYNQYILKRFFEYALNNKQYVQGVLNGNTGLYKKMKYCPKHEKVIITAFITSLSRNPRVLLYKRYYDDYLNLKTSFMGWRGRSDWFDFHKTILSHFIWIDDTDTFSWTWSKITEYMKGFKKKYPRISDWRRRWYLQEVGKLRLYIIDVCVASNRISFLQKIFETNVIKVNKSVENTMIKFGYECSTDFIVKKANFTNTKEWKWLLGELDDTQGICVSDCFEICMKSKFNKKKLINLFQLNKPDIFWEFFLNADYNQIKFLTCKNICQIISNDRFNITHINMKRRIIRKIFDFRSHLTYSLLKSLRKCLNKYVLSITCGTYMILNIILSGEGDNDYSYMTDTCNLFIDENRINISTLDKKIKEQLHNLSSDQLYWLYTLLGERISPIIGICISTKKTQMETNDICPICLTSIYDNTDCICTFPCGHSFHNNCINKDINSGRYADDGTNPIYNCPMCRSKIHQNWVNNRIAYANTSIS